MKRSKRIPIPFNDGSLQPSVISKTLISLSTRLAGRYPGSIKGTGISWECKVGDRTENTHCAYVLYPGQEIG